MDELQLQPRLPDGGRCGQAEWDWRDRLRGQSRDHEEARRAQGEEETRDASEVFFDARSRASSDDQGQDADETLRINRSRGALPVPVEQVLGRPGDQLDALPPGPALRVQVEDVCMDGPHSGGCEAGVRIGGQMEKESQVADASTRATAGSDVGPSRLGEADVQRPPSSPPDDRKSPSCHGPSRGLEQKLRRGVARGNRNFGLLTLIAACNVEWVVMEIFPTHAPWHRADPAGQWKAAGPVWEKGVPPSKQCQRVMEQVRDAKPDLVVIGPPSGPWSPWWQGSARETMEHKVKFWPMWRLIWEIWEYQTSHHRLVLLQVPGKMRPPDPDEMRRLHFEYYKFGKHGADPGLHEQDGPREPRYDVRVDMCQWGAMDEYTKRPTRRRAMWKSMMPGGVRSWRPLLVAIMPPDSIKLLKERPGMLMEVR